MDVLRAKLRRAAPLWAPLLLGLLLALGLVGVSRWLGFGGAYTVF